MIEAPRTVVIVDDVVEVRSLVRAQLRLSGRYVVVGEGGDGLAAIALAGRHRPAVLLLDVSMPGMGGLAALARIPEVAPTTKVVMYTGFKQAGLAERARELGAAALIEKAYLMDQLPSLLDTLLLGEPSTPPLPDAPEPSEELGRDGQVLDEHLERFGEVFEQAAIGMATMTLTGEIVRANKALAGLVGHSVDELVGVPYLSLAAAADPGVVNAALQRAITGGGVVQFEHRVDLSAGPRWVLASVAPVRDAQGRALYLFFQIQNITAQRSTEEALRQSEERFGLLVDAVEDYAIFMLDTDGRVISWNSGAQRIKGYSAAEILGQHFRVFYPPDKQAAAHPEHELELALTDGHYEEEGWRIRKDGSRFWASVVITAVHDRQGKHIGYAKVTRDIDERRQMLLDLDRAAVALTAANTKLEAANGRLAQEVADQAQFLAVTAHELRTPVTVLTGSANLLVQHWQQVTAAERAELFESMQMSAQRLQRLLADLLTAARLGSDAGTLRRQRVDLGALLTKVVAAARASAPNADIEVDVSPGLDILAEPDRLAQAVDNLVGNALRHGATPIRLRAARRGDRAEITVTDAGAGIAADIEPRLFQRFATGRGGGGTGLGLFIVRELARAHGGDAWYQPAAGSGSCFVMSLPTDDVPTAEAPAASPQPVDT